MLKKLTFLLLLSSGSLNADWNQALFAYEQQDYHSAKQHFTELVKVGNPHAMFSLAAMYFNGEGTAANPSQAAALFTLAAVYGHADAAALSEQLRASFEPGAELAYQQQLQQWQQQLVIPAGPTEHRSPSAVQVLQPLKRIEPRYPVEAAKRGQAGYVRLHYRVDEHGKVNDITVLDAYPEQLFVKAAVKALENWRYPAGQPMLTTTELSFTLEISGLDRLNIANLKQLLFQSRLWDLAQAGSPEHQLMLSRVMRFIASQGAQHFIIDTELPITAPDLDLLESKLQLAAAFDTLPKQALVEVDAAGVIIEAESNDELLGKQLTGVRKAGHFLLQPLIVNKKTEILVQPAHTVSRAWSAEYWVEQAARHGKREAQRLLATTDLNWQTYLLSQQDPVVMAWQATGLLPERNY